MLASRSARKNSSRGLSRDRDAATPYSSHRRKKIHGSLADTVEISTTQFDGLACRKEAGTGPTIRKKMGGSKVDARRNNRELEDWLDFRMRLLHYEKERCEEARHSGAESFRSIQNAESK